MQIRVLGTLEVDTIGALVPLGGAKQRTVLALLIQAVGRRVSIDALIHGVYGEQAPPGARRTVQTYVSNLRHELGDAIRSTGDGYVLDLEASAVDASRFEAAYNAAGGELEHEPQRAAARLSDALESWRGHPYADVEAHGALDAEINRLQELRWAALERRIEADLALGRHRELIGELESLTTEQPFREHLRGYHLVALYRAGRQGHALAAVEQTRRLLADELGLDLSPQLQQLERRILMQDPGLEVEVGSRVERRTILVAVLDAEAWGAGHRAALLLRRDELLADIVDRTGAVIVGLRGTAVFVAFGDATSAIESAVALAQVDTDPNLRLALDHGDVEVRDEEMTGPPINRAARIVALAHRGEVLLSPEVHQALVDGRVAGWSATALGQHPVIGVDTPLALYRLHGHGLPVTFPSRRTDRVPPPVPRVARSSLPGYELRSPIAANDLGTVYRAYQASIGREVAVRAIRHGLAADPAFIRRFEAEGQRVARVAHPHVLPLLDYWRDPDGAYLVHPLVTGGDLRQHVSREGLTAAAALAVLEQVGAALAHAHDRGVVHGRLHPGNVLLDESANIYVADLGLAQMCEATSVGSAHAYRAPETLGGGPAGVATDVYALGVLAFEVFEGRPPPLDGPLPLSDDAVGAVLARATSLDPAHRQTSVSVFLGELRSARTGAPVSSAQLTPARNPYKGLEPFLEADARDFHGREDLVGEMTGMLGTHRLLAVVGPSGIGKSSLVHAGLVPALRGGAVEGSQHWLVTHLSPGAHPFERLAAALLRVAVDTSPDVVGELHAAPDGLVRSVQQLLPPDRDLLLVIDQFEELFTQTGAEATRRRFLEVLAATADPGSRVRIVLTLRADFFDRPLRYAAFAEVMRRGVVAVRAPSRTELARSVHRPATGVGVTVEPRLVDRIVHDAEGQAGALPLVQHVLSVAFAERDTDVLTLASYEASGGLDGAIGRRAEGLYLGLTSGQQRATRDVLLRLVTVDEAAEPVRRRVRLTELHELGLDRSDVERALKVLGHDRMLTFDHDPVTRSPTVEVAHEALLSEWERLRGWIAADRDDLLLRRRIVAAAREWEDGGRDPSFLLRGARLESAEQWRRSSGLPLTEVEQSHLAASRTLADTEQARARRRRRRTVGGLAAALLVTAVFSAVAVAQRGAAEEQTRLTRARELAGDASLAVSADPERGLLLALEAIETHQDAEGRPVAEATSALHDALQDVRVELHLPAGAEHLAVSPDGRLLATGSPGTPGSVRVVDLTSGEEVADFGAGATAVGMAFSPDGTTLAVGLAGSDDGTAVATFDVGTWRPLRTYDGITGAHRQVQFTDDGTHVATATSGAHVTAWKVDTGAVTVALPGAIDVAAVSGSAGIAVTFGEEEVLVVDARDGRTIQTLPTPGIRGEAVAVSPDGTRVAVNAFERRIVEVWDLETGVRGAAVANTSPLAVAFAPDGRLVHTSNDGTIRLVQLDGEPDELVLRGHTDGVTDVAFDAAGDVLASASWAPEARTWDITAAGPVELGTLAVAGGTADDVVVRDGRAAFATSLPDSRQRIDLVDLRTGGSTTVLDGLTRATHHLAVVAGDLGSAAGLDHDLRAHVYDLPTGRSRLELAPCSSPRAISGDGSRLVTDGRMLCTTVEGTVQLMEPPADADLRSAVIDGSTGAVLRDLGERPINMAAFGPAGTPGEGLVVVSVDWTTIELHDVDGDRLLGSLELDGQWTTTIWFSDDGRRISYSTQSGHTTVLDVAAASVGTPLEQAVVWRLREPAGGVVTHARIAGGLLATGGLAGHVRLYDLSQRQQLADIAVTVRGPVPITFTDDATALLYRDGPVVRRFELDTDRLVALARGRLTRGLTAEECAQYRLERSCPPPGAA